MLMFLYSADTQPGYIQATSYSGLLWAIVPINSVFKAIATLFGFYNDFTKAFKILKIQTTSTDLHYQIFEYIYYKVTAIKSQCRNC